MDVYVYQEKQGEGLVYISTNQGSEIKIKTVNGVDIPINRNDYVLLTTVTAIYNASNNSNKDYAITSSALKTFVTNLGSGDISVGFAALGVSEQLIATANRCGSDAQVGDMMPELLKDDNIHLYNYFIDGNSFDSTAFMATFNGITPTGYASLEEYKDALVNKLTATGLDTITL